MTTEIDIPKLESALLEQEQVECPLVHRFAPGVYLREVFMPAGTFVLGHRHNTEHFNIVLKGRARVLIDGDMVEEISAPYTFASKPGVRKVLYVLEDMVWQTVHPTDETDIEKLESELVSPSREFLTHHEQQLLLGS